MVQTRKTGQGSAAVQRPLALCCLSFSGGVFAGVYLLAGWQQLLLGALLLYCGLAALLKRAVRWGLVLLGLTAGLWLSWGQMASLRLLELHYVGRTVTLDLLVEDFPQESAYGVYVGTRVQAGELEGEAVSLWLPQGQALQPGDRLEAQVTLESAQDEDPDWRYAQLSQGIRLQGEADWAVVSPGELPLSLWPKVWAHRLGQGLERCLPRDQASFLLALTTGERKELSTQLEEQLSATGLSHVVAASGLHVHLLFSVLALLPMGRRGRGAVLLPLLVLFAALAGFTPSICRAAIMEGTWLLGSVLDRKEDGWTAFSLALALLLGQNVFSATRVGLQLSFAAVFGLRVICPPLRLRLWEAEIQGWKKWVLQSLCTTLGANVFTIPLVLYHFGTASLLAPVSNLVVLWLLPALLPLGLACGLGGWLCLPLGQVLALPVGLLTELVLGLVQALARVPWSTLPEGEPFLVWVLLCYWAGLLLVAGRCTLRQTGISILLLLGLLPVAGWAVQGAQTPVALQAGLLDVGQGQCLVLESQGETAVVDCGGGSCGGALEPVLAGLGTETVDRLFLTHYDWDHIAGVFPLLLTGRVDRLCLPIPQEEDRLRAEWMVTLAGERGTQVEWLEGEETVSLGTAQLTWTVLEGEDGRGLALLAQQGDFSLLVTGDADEQGEEALMGQWELDRIQVLVAGHHGSAEATGEGLLDALRPQVTLFSVGTNNPYGHPAQETLDRCRRVGVQILRTDQNGTIWLKVFQEGGKELDGRPGV